MRLLKNKIQASRNAKQRSTAHKRRKATQLTAKTPRQTLKPSGKLQNVENDEPKRRKRLQGRSITPKIYLETKNIVTNFGKAIVAFAASELANPYLSSMVEKLQGEDHIVEITSFLRFTENIKGNIASINSLRALMLEEESDSPLNSVCKKLFRMIAEIFIKYFSVNWITHSRIAYKMAHLKFRHRMLRRVRNPELFTYLKGYSGQRRGSKNGSEIIEKS